MESVKASLLVIEGAQTKNVFTISLSVKQGSEGDLIEDSEILLE